MKKSLMNKDEMRHGEKALWGDRQTDGGEGACGYCSAS